jgi:hypothetical protein
MTQARVARVCARHLRGRDLLLSRGVSEATTSVVGDRGDPGTRTIDGA